MEVMEEKNVYLDDFARFEKEPGAAGRPALLRTRKAAIARFAERGFPTLDEEEWRFTNVAPLVQVPFRRARKEDLGRDAFAALARLVAAESARNCLVFVNGEFSDLSRTAGLPAGVVAVSLAAALARQPDHVEPHLARLARYDENPFTALNTAFLKDGAFVHVPRGVAVAEPIHLVFVSTANGEPAVAYPRNLVVAGAGSRVTLVESYVGRDGDVYFTNAVTEVVVEQDAVVDHYKLQREGRDAFHVATMQIQQERGSNFSSHAVTLGGAITRNDVNAYLGAENCEATLNGLYLGTGRQLIDNHTRIDHARPHCASHELYKGILDGHARGVFNGKIFVHQDAQKTDAKQTNKTLLLSGDAVIDTKPQLEIYADDVKCTHGATIGQLDANALFYLRSRGLALEAARSLLTYAFANDVIERVRVEPVRARLEEDMLARQRLPAGREVS